MRLEQMAFSARPRMPWEAIDLGLRMARRWWRPLFLSWLILVVPFWLVLMLTPLTAVSAITIVLWLKPLWERPLLYILSNAVFGDVPSLGQTLRMCPRLMRRQWFSAVTWRRLSPTRSFDMSLAQLEGLGGSARQQRMRLLHLDQYGPAVWLTLIGANVEAVLAFSAMLLVVAFAPQTEASTWLEALARQPTVISAFYLLAMALVAPFYVAAGFALYLNRRIRLEGWDIELGFRQMAQRHSRKLGGSVAALLLLLALPTLLAMRPESASAATTEVTDLIEQPSVQQSPVQSAQQLTPESSRQRIEQIVHSDDLEQHEVTRYPRLMDDWKWSGDKHRTSHRSPQWVLSAIRYLSESVAWLGWGVVILLVLLVAFRYRHWLAQSFSRDRLPKRPDAPAKLFGLDLNARSLPADPLAAARELWGQGHLREAVSLMYRALLVYLVRVRHVQLLDGHTEGDCLRLVQATGDLPLTDYFGQLTQVWLRLAYAHRTPDASQFARLCEDWQRVIPPTLAARVAEESP